MVSLLFTLILVGLMMLTGRMQALENQVPERYWISLGGGISLSYVFTTFLAELSHRQEGVRPLGWPIVDYLFQHIHLVMLIGILCIYGLEWIARHHRTQAQNLMPPSLYGIHLGFFSVYVLLVGYLLQHSPSQWFRCALLTLALGVHLSITTRELWQYHPRRFQQQGRWLLSGSLLLGWFWGRMMLLPESLLTATIAFIAGVLMFQVLKHELPERGGHFGAFLLGVVVNSGLLITVALIHHLEGIPVHP
ncbi:MAG: hypothetical protein OHK0012_22150 [Synechococcales cyanobacterium]